LFDHKVSGFSGFEALELARKRQPDVPVIILSGALDDEQAVQSVKRGAADYIVKEKLPRLIPAIRRALDEADDGIIKAAVDKRIREQASLLNQTRDAILVRNMNDQIVYWNPGAESQFGWSAEEVLGQDFRNLLQGDSVQLDKAKTSLMESGDWLGEIQLKRKSGEARTMMSRWNLLRGKDGQPRSILSTNTDVTGMRVSAT
jgi:PAS domain S-box-containing protein